MRRKETGPVAGASRSRFALREPEAPATTPRKPPGDVAGASRSRFALREPEAPATTPRKPPGDVAGASRSRFALREPDAPASLFGSRRLPKANPGARRSRHAPLCLPPIGSRVG
jgi:hypothetical protein